jgi:hypothetical protein
LKCFDAVTKIVFSHVIPGGILLARFCALYHARLRALLREDLDESDLPRENRDEVPGVSQGGNHRLPPGVNLREALLRRVNLGENRRAGCVARLGLDVFFELVAGIF